MPKFYCAFATVFYRSVACLLCLSALTACTTTGDPQQGGLFGWSERKAQTRQEAMHQEIATQQETTQEQAEEHQYLRSVRQATEARLQQLRTVFTHATDENRQLRHEISRVMDQKHLATEQLDHLREALAELSLPPDVRARFDRLANEDDQYELVERIKQANQRLREALQGVNAP